MRRDTEALAWGGWKGCDHAGARARGQLANALEMDFAWPVTLGVERQVSFLFEAGKYMLRGSKNELQYVPTHVQQT